MAKSKEQGQEQTAQQYDVFFSYSHDDMKTAMLIKSAIQSLGYSVFYDQDVLDGDSNWRATISKNLDSCSGLVFFRTQDSVESKWCQREVNIADDAGKTILPVAFRRGQKELPSSPDLQAALINQQTCFISDPPTISDLKNELQPALEKAIGRPQGKENSLLLTDLMVTAADNLNARYKDLFDEIEARRIESDVLNDRISFSWPFVIGDEQAKLCIALNKFSKRPVCYANCSDIKKNGSCRFFAEKGRTEYSLEAYLDFAVRDRQSRFEDLLQKIFCKSGEASDWCGNRGTKYFFRQPILTKFKDNDVNDKNDLTAVLILLQEAVRFFDACFEKQKYFRFAHEIVSLFREKDPAALIGKEWTLHDERKSRVKLHFTKNVPSDPDRSQLGILCSNAIDFPEALRIKLESIEQGKADQEKGEVFAWIRISRFNGNSSYKESIKFGIADFGQQLKKLKEAIQRIMDLPADKLKRASLVDEHIHERLNAFINAFIDKDKAPALLEWEVSQDNTGCHLTASCWFHGCPEIRFVTGLEYHSDTKSYDWEQTITSSFPGAAEDEADRLSKITGFRKFSRKDIKNPKDIFPGAWTEETLRSLGQVHAKVSREICGPLKALANVSCRWKTRNANTVLLSDSRSNNGTDWNDNRGLPVTPCKPSGEYWEYYLAPRMRFCRRLREKEFPVMFCVRFARSGAQDATVGWVADGDFKFLSDREKELFWYYVLSQFPEELRGRFCCRKNAVFLAKAEDRPLDFRKRRPEVFGTAQGVKTLLENEWLKNVGSGHDCLMDRMFSAIENAVKIFNIVNPENRPAKDKKQ